MPTMTVMGTPTLEGRTSFEDSMVVQQAVVTPESVLAMMQTRLRDMDRQVDSTMRALNHATEQAQSIGRDLGQVRDAMMMLESKVKSDGGYEVNAAELELMTLGDGTSIASVLREQGIPIPPTKSAFDQAVTGLNDDIRTANASNEMMMIQLQSAMQQRTSIIQLGSNVLKSIDEGIDSVVGNLR